MAKSFLMYDGRPPKYAIVSWIGSFTGVITLFVITYAFELIPGLKDYWIVENWVVGGAGAFGAQSVLVFALPANPASQPWNCVFGSMISAFIGVSFRKIFVLVQQMTCSEENVLAEDQFDCHSDVIRPDIIVLATALANSISIVVMHLTDSVHPPAGAFTYIAINASAKIRSLGYFYVLLPVGIGSVWFISWAWFVNKYIDLMLNCLFSTKNSLDFSCQTERRATDAENITGQNTIVQTSQVLELSDDVIENISKPKTKTSNRNYPTGDGIGGWIRPLRKKQ